MKFHLENPEQYLHKTEKQVQRRKLPDNRKSEEIINSLSRRLTGLPWEQEGEMKFITEEEGGEESETTTLTVEYDSEITKMLQEYIDYLDKKMVEFKKYHRPDDYRLPIPVADYRHINDLKLEKGEKQFSLKQFIGEEVDVYCYMGDKPHDNTRDSRGLFVKTDDGKSGLILCGQDPTSLIGLSVLLHEAGHVLQDRLSSEEEKINSEKCRVEFIDAEEPLDPKSGAEIISEERYADSFRLNILRSFFAHSEDLDNIARLGHSDRSIYHKEINRRIEGKSRIDIMDYI